MINWIKNIFKKAETEILPALEKTEEKPTPATEKPKATRGRTKKINKTDTKDK